MRNKWNPVLQGALRRSIVCIALAFASSATAGGDPYASVVIDYDPGSNATGGYTNPQVALGEPTRFTGKGVFPGVVSQFNPAYMPTEIVSIGSGGWLIVGFDTPIQNDPLNPYNIDLLVFGNTGFIDASFPNGIVGGVFGNDGGVIEVSADGVNWFEIPGVHADGLFPTVGYLDSGPYDLTPGSVLSDFRKPVDPSLTLDDFMGLNHEQVMALYDGSGGGAGVDIGLTGLSEISFVRILNLGPEALEIDAFARVRPIPAPGATALLALGVLAVRGRRRRERV